MRYVNSVSKKFQNFSFFDKNWSKIIDKNTRRAGQLNDILLISTKTLALLSLVWKYDSKYSRCPLRDPKIEIFFGSNSAKKIFGGWKFGIK